MYSAEKQITKALPKLADAAGNSELRNAFQNHLVETEAHLDDLALGTYLQSGLNVAAKN